MKQKSNARKIRTRQLWILLLMLWITPLTLSAQNITVKGNVTDSQGEPVIGASIGVVGMSSIGTATDLDGNFTLNVPSGSKLSVSYLGMITKEVQATTGTTMNIILEEDSQS
ncbi:MAG: carboxypeptidase-like regulatory domain-containing protein, partial [Dysgonamonadaceae bacterium]|nr:carboxypeptidase-like regulatory domain-containing protein [Dysgonamonadaceae bacterium]